MNAARFLFACAAVLTLSVAARASAYTLKTTPSGATVRWHRPSVELELAMGEGSALSRGEVMAALHRAAAAWAIPGTPRITVREGEPGTWGVDGVNGVYVLERWPFPEPRLAVTVAAYGAGGALIDTDILINGEMPLAVLDGKRPDRRYDLVLVLTHEMGHVLGLDESEEADATMWHHIGRGETERRTLSADDIDGALALYPPDAQPIGCTAAPRGSPESALAPVALLLATLAGRRRARRRISPRNAPAGAPR